MAALVLFSLIHDGLTSNTFPSKSELSFLRSPFYQKVFCFLSNVTNITFKLFKKTVICIDKHSFSLQT